MRAKQHCQKSRRLESKRERQQECHGDDAAEARQNSDCQTVDHAKEHEQ